LSDIARIIKKLKRFERSKPGVASAWNAVSELRLTIHLTELDQQRKADVLIKRGSDSREILATEKVAKGAGSVLHCDRRGCGDCSGAYADASSAVIKDVVRASLS
jgi:hypothetical protein